MNLREYLRCELIHRAPRFAEPSARIIAKQWNHKEFEIKRNLDSMTNESKNTLPCHLALVLKIPLKNKMPKVEDDDEQRKELDCLVKDLGLPCNEDVVVGHVKISRADGRSDGACCISYSLVVDSKFRGLGFGRVLTEKAEDRARSLGLSYMYLSTNDKVSFYEHLGYKQCEAVSSLGNNSKLLNANQVNALEGLFAKRLNMATPSECNTWLRKRLVDEYPMHQPLKDADHIQNIGLKLEGLYGNLKSVKSGLSYKALCLPVPWQQQTGPSCGISAMNMLNESVKGVSRPLNTPLTMCSKCANNTDRCEQDVTFAEGTNALRMAIDLGVSSDGELFCAYNFSLVATKALSLHTAVSEDWNVGGILEELLSGFPLAVPYDRSLSDHRPGLFAGVKAHWCIVSGFITHVGDYEDIVKGDFHLMKLPNGQSILSTVQDQKEFRSKVHQDLVEGNINEDVMLVCMHSMSKAPFVCSYQELFQSNQQLMSSKSKFYMAPEDLTHLRGKFLTINR